MSAVPSGIDTLTASNVHRYHEDIKIPAHGPKDHQTSACEAWSETFQFFLRCLYTCQKVSRPTQYKTTATESLSTGHYDVAWQVEMGWPDIHWLARDLGWAGGSHCLSLDMKLCMPLEPKLAPCGWRCPHRRPALTGPFGNW